MVLAHTSWISLIMKKEQLIRMSMQLSMWFSSVFTCLTFSVGIETAEKTIPIIEHFSLTSFSLAAELNF